MNLLGQIDWVKEIIFWLLFFFFNFSVFALHSIICWNKSALIPFKDIFRKRYRGIFIDNNIDFYRICFDLSLLILLCRYGVLGRNQTGTSFYFIFIFIYNIYHYSFTKIYQVLPIFSNDIRLIANAFGIMWAESKLKVLLFIFFAVGINIIMFFGFRNFLYFSGQLPPNSVFILLSCSIIFYTIIGFWRKGLYVPRFDLAHRILIMPARIFNNLKSSYYLRRKMKMLDLEILEQKRNINLNLSEKPNIYCIFIESYGSILLKEEELKEEFKKGFKSFDNSLKREGWSVTNNYSESVSPVGPSWLAYTSVLFGNKVSNNFEYEFLINQKKLYRYDTLMKIFMKEGYKSYNLNATKAKVGVRVPFDQIKGFYGIDQWILRDDIKFKGARHGFTESPPDQYVMNYAFEEIISKVKKDPFILFYLTKNSHSPFISPEFPEKNWKDLDGENEDLIGGEFLKRPKFSDYMKAIKYQLLFLNDFIINQGDENDVFLLVGDHQPHELGNLDQYGKETLVHVISKNKEFVDGFKEYGFRNDINKLNEPIKHEAIYSMFIREIMKSYGKDGAKIPPYEPEGIQF